MEQITKDHRRIDRASGHDRGSGRTAEARYAGALVDAALELPPLEAA